MRWEECGGRRKSTQNTFKTRCELEYAQVSIKGHPHTHPRSHKIHIDSGALVKGKRIGQGVSGVARFTGRGKQKRKHCNNVQKYVTNTCSVHTKATKKYSNKYFGPVDCSRERIGSDLGAVWRKPLDTLNRCNNGRAGERRYAGLAGSTCIFIATIFYLRPAADMARRGRGRGPKVVGKRLRLGLEQE